MKIYEVYEEIKNIGDVDLKNLIIDETSNSLIITAKKKIYVPEKKIILMNQMTEQDSRF